MPVPVPMPGWAGRERKGLRGPVPGARHASGIAVCRSVGGIVGKALGAAVASGPGRRVEGGGGCRDTLGTCPAPWALSGQGRVGRGAWWGCATLGTLCHPRTLCHPGNPMPLWGPFAIPVPASGPCASLRTLCQRRLGAVARGGGFASMPGCCGER